MPIYILPKSYITVNTYSSKNIEYAHLLADYGDDAWPLIEFSPCEKQKYQVTL